MVPDNLIDLLFILIHGKHATKTSKNENVRCSFRGRQTVLVLLAMFLTKMFASRVFSDKGHCV